MPTTYTPDVSTDAFTLRYTRGDQEHELELRSRRIITAQQITSTLLNADIRSAYGTIICSGAAWSSDDAVPDGVYHRTDSWREISYIDEYKSNLYTEEQQEEADFLNDLIDDLSADGSPDLINVLSMGSSDDRQWYDASLPESDRTNRTGQSCTFADEGSLILSLFGVTTYNPDPVTTTHNGAIFSIKTHESQGAAYLRPSGSTGTYSSADPPRIGLWTVDVLMDDADHDGDHLGQHVPCLLIIAVTPGGLTRSAIISINALDPSVVIDDPTTTDPDDTVTPYGWVGDFHYDSDSDDISAITGYDYVNRWKHGIRLYMISDTQASSFMDALWGMTLSQAADLAIDSLFFRGNVDFLRGVICLHKLPVQVIPSLTTDPLTIMGYDLWSKFPGLGSFARVEGTYGSVIQVHTDEIPVDYTFGDTVWLDWSSCRAMVRLPFVGTVPIDIKAIRGGTIQVCYNVDVLTGNLVAQIFARSSVKAKPKILIYQGSGNCALPIPYSGNTEGAYKQLGAMAGIAGGIAGMAAGSPIATIGAIGAAGSMLSNAGSSADYRYIQSETSSLTDLSCKLIITGDMPVVPEKSREMIGYPAASTYKIASYEGSGWLSGTVHAEIAGATAAEKLEIEKLIKGGIVV